jgi:magnesium transporter
MGRRRRRHPPGTSPGTIGLPVGAELAQPAILTRFTAAALEEVKVDRLDAVAVPPEPGQLVWLDIEGHDRAMFDELARRFEIPALVLEDVVDLGQRPKVEEYDGCLFVVSELITRPSPDERVCLEQVSLVLKGGRLFSFRERPGNVFEPVRRRLREGKGRIRIGGLDYLAYALLDVVVDHCFPVLEDLGDRIERIEEGMEDAPTRELLTELHGVRRDLLLIRRTAWPQREMVNRLLRAEDDLIQKETRVFLRDVADHLTMIVDMVESYREMAISLMELYMSAVSNRMNEVMKVLTIIATIFIPLSFIAGVWGMNFDRAAGPLSMPELGWFWGYPMALGVMAMVALGMLAFFRRRGWI